MKFDIINQMNEAIKSINGISFRIRLCALNSQISISNIIHDSGKVSGFSPIPEELIRISNLLEKKSTELFRILYESLSLSTQERKIVRNKSLQQLFFSHYNSLANPRFNLQTIENSILKKYNFELLGISDKLKAHFKSLKTILNETSKLCKFSKPLVYSVKIESAYVGENLEVFHQLADELSTSIIKIEILIKEIQTLNLELEFA